MHMPSFTAEAGLGRTFGLYRGGPTIQAPGAPAIIPAFDWDCFWGSIGQSCGDCIGGCIWLGLLP